MSGLKILTEDYIMRANLVHVSTHLGQKPRCNWLMTCYNWVEKNPSLGLATHFFVIGTHGDFFHSNHFC